MIHFYKEVLKLKMFYCFDDMNFFSFCWKPGFHLNYSVDSQKKNDKNKNDKKNSTEQTYAQLNF